MQNITNNSVNRTIIVDQRRFKGYCNFLIILNPSCFNQRGSFSANPNIMRTVIYYLEVFKACTKHNRSHLVALFLLIIMMTNIGFIGCQFHSMVEKKMDNHPKLTKCVERITQYVHVLMMLCVVTAQFKHPRVHIWGESTIYTQTHARMHARIHKHTHTHTDIITITIK